MNIVGVLSGKRKCLLAIAIAFSTFGNAQLVTYPEGLNTGMPHNDDYTVKEMEGVTIIIDYYKDSSETEHNRGIVHDYLLQRPGKLYVLATHFHPDHFNREILTWKEQRPDIQYIFSKDILKSHRAKAEDAFYIEKGETYEDD